jgi:hypothetical protein
MWFKYLIRVDQVQFSPIKFSVKAEMPGIAAWPVWCRAFSLHTGLTYNFENYMINCIACQLLPRRAGKYEDKDHLAG